MTRLLKYWPLLLITVIAAIILLKVKGCADKKKAATTVEQVVKSKTDTARQWKDDTGRQHAEKEIVTADLALIKAGYDREIDSLTAILRIKEKQLQAYAGISTITSGSVIPLVNTVILDSGHGCRSDFSYSDCWIDLSGTVGPASVINYLVRDSLAVTTYNRPGGLFGTDKTLIDVYSLNPNVRVTGLSGFQVSVKKPGRIGIGPYVGYGYAFGKWSPSAGIAIHYSLIRL